MTQSQMQGLVAGPRGSDRLVEEVASAIRSGGIGFGQRLAPSRDLAGRYGISTATVCRALERLQHEGLVRVAQGSGTYVTYRPEAPVEAGAVHVLMDSRGHVFSHIAASVIEGLQEHSLPAVPSARRRHRGFEQFAGLLAGFREAPPRAIVLHWIEPRLDEAIDRICGERTRVILTMRPEYRAPARWMSVNPDYRAAYRMIGRDLIAQGHRRIGLLVHSRLPRPDHPEEFRKATAGHTEHVLMLGRALREAGIPRHGLTVHYMTRSRPAPSLSADDALTEQRRLARQWVDRIAQWLSQPDRPTAIIGEDNRSVAAVRAAERLGLRIPQDLAVVGMGNTPWAEAADLTSFWYDEEAIGRHIVQLVTAEDDRLEGGAHHILVRPKLVVRSSCPVRPERAPSGDD